MQSPLGGAADGALIKAMHPASVAAAAAGTSWPLHAGLQQQQQASYSTAESQPMEMDEA
jgi:hypothetical protein